MNWNRRTKTVVSVMALLLIGVLLIALYSTMHWQGEGKEISL